MSCVDVPRFDNCLVQSDTTPPKQQVTLDGGNVQSDPSYISDLGKNLLRSFNSRIAACKIRGTSISCSTCNVGLEVARPIIGASARDHKPLLLTDWRDLVDRSQLPIKA